MTRRDKAELLKQSNGKPWKTEDGLTVPKKCPKCGEDMGLLLIFGEPVFVCKGKDKHFYGTLKFPEEGEE